MTQPQPLPPPRTVLTCPADASHKIRRQPPGSVLSCPPAARRDGTGVTVAVTAPLPSIRPPVPADPGGHRHHRPPQDRA